VLSTPLCDRLGINVPILLAPMAGGPTTPELVAAVTGAGGLGIFGVQGMTPDAVRAAVRRALELAGPPVGVNVQLAPRVPGPGDRDATNAFLAPFRDELGVAPPAERDWGANPPEALVAAGLEAGATVVSAALGDPAPVADLTREAGAPLLAMVTSVAEARAAVASGADVIVAQGAEAGGHRSTFDLAAGAPLTGTMALVPRIVDAVEVPVVAAGGIADGRGVAAALALGAQAVAVGTRFLLAEEAGVADAYQEALLGLEETDTRVTDAVTGRPARWVANRITRALDEEGPPSLGWPDQRGPVDPIRHAAGQAGRGDLLPMLAGQGPPPARVQPAAEIMAELASGAEAILRRLGDAG
jgi:nitronate monooxygenase